MRVVIAVWLLAASLGCAQTGPAPATAVATESPQGRRAPAKCTACHLTPAEHSLAAEQWPTYLKAHKRRLHLSDEAQAFLYDFLVGGALPTAKVP